MLQMVLGLVAGLVLALVVVLIVVGRKKAQEKLVAQVKEAEAKVVMMQEDLVRKYRGKEIKISENVSLQLDDNFHVVWVSAYEQNYQTISTAIQECNHELTDEEFDKLDNLDEVITKISSESMKNESKQEKVAKKQSPITAAYETRDMLDGTYHIYRPCKIKFEPLMDSDLKTADTKYRMIAEIGYAKDSLKMEVKTVYAAKTDVFDKAERYPYDFLNAKDKESFNLMIRKDKLFANEIHDFEILEERLHVFNSLVEKKRVAVDEFGNVTIFPPSPEEIKAKKDAEAKKADAEAKKKADKEKTVPHEAAKEAPKAPKESTKETTAKEEVEEQFISSSDAV